MSNPIARLWGRMFPKRSEPRIDGNPDGLQKADEVLRAAGVDPRAWQRGDQWSSEEIAAREASETPVALPRTLNPDEFRDALARLMRTEFERGVVIGRQQEGRAMQERVQRFIVPPLSEAELAELVKHIERSPIMVRQTHTFVELELSPGAYDEIATKLREAGYGHAFTDAGAIDMQGIAVTLGEDLPTRDPRSVAGKPVTFKEIPWAGESPKPVEIDWNEV